MRVYVRIRRSTKAGPSGPATPGTSTVATPLSSRSTKAGPSGPATPGEQPEHAHAAGRRSTKAGPSGPATPARTPSDARLGPRSTKAGPSGPATRDILRAGADVAHRSTKAGPSGPATPVVWRRGRLPARPRSTKAGPSGPATPGTPFDLHDDVTRSTKAGPSGPATLYTSGLVGCSGLLAQRRPALPGRQPCPTSTIGALSHTSNIGECGKGAEKQRSRLRLASVLKDHSRFADRYRTHGSPNSRDRGRPSVVRDSWIGPAKR